jgi:branched-subunit amino acid transport protein AzlD
VIPVKTAVAYTFAVAGTVFLCRAFPFLLLRRKKGGAGEEAAAREKGGSKARDFFLPLVERVLPPAAMTALAVNSVASPLREDWRAGMPALAAALLTLVLQVARRNYLLSILGGTLAYMLLARFLP